MEKVVGKALPGPGRANHPHKVVLVGKFKREEESEPQHHGRKGKKRAHGRVGRRAY